MTLLILRIGFLLLLWLFIFAVLYALRSDLFGSPVRKLPADRSASAAPQAAAPVVAGAPAAPAPSAPTAPTAPAAASPAPQGGPARQLVITSGVASGTAVPLDDDTLTIGRSSGSSLVIVDEYTSTYHAKLTRSGDTWLLTDLDSTNGTKLNGSRVTGTVLVPPFTPVTIGTTTFELRP
nr:FHA domain-containing protein [Leucobacter weissii]